MNAELPGGERVRVPAEWEPLAALWLAWPHRRETWPGHFEPVPNLYTRWVARIAESTPVRVLASGEAAQTAHAAIGQLANVDIVEIATNDAWIRDYGPTFVLDKQQPHMHGVDWQYNAWGGKYPPWDCDNAAASA